MKHFIACFLGIILFASCIAEPKIYKFGHFPVNIPIMPFMDKEENLGYINTETFEIVIPAQYVYASHFENGFAIVAEKTKYTWWAGYRYIYFVINKNNEVVLKNIDNVRIINSEDGKTVFALTENYSGLESYRTKGPDFGNTYTAYKPVNTNYRLYDLITGKLLWEEKFGYDNTGYKIKFYGNYMLFTYAGYSGWYRYYLYEMATNGIYEEINTDIEEVKELVKEINPENTFGSDEEEEYVNRLIAKIDMDLLIRNLPENFRIGRWFNYEKIWENNDWIYHIMIDDDSNGRLINRSFEGQIGSGFIRPLRKKTWLFSVDLITQDKKEYIALYDTSENKWIIPHIERKYYYEYFHETEYNDWIMHNNDYYNIRSREKYKYLYKVCGENMTYMGYYYDENDEEKFVVEKF
jgi:hypothetical protein